MTVSQKRGAEASIHFRACEAGLLRKLCVAITITATTTTTTTTTITITTTTINGVLLVPTTDASTSQQHVCP